MSYLNSHPITGYSSRFIITIELYCKSARRNRYNLPSLLEYGFPKQKMREPKIGRTIKWTYKIA